MKIGINLVGISSDPVGQDAMEYVGGSKERDWSFTKEHIISKVIGCWGENEVKTYLFSYQNNDIDDIINWYKPTKHNFIPFEGSHQQTTYIKSLEQLVDEDLDFIISTRFDIKFYKPLSEYDIDFSKSNFFFKEADGWWHNPICKFTNDALFMIPKIHLNDWIQALKNLHANPPRVNPDLHGAYRFVTEIIGEENAHFLLDVERRSANGDEWPFQTEYRLIRKPDPNLEPHDVGKDWKLSI